MNDDGTMARMADLVAFAQHHGLKLGTIADLIAHRRRTERLVRRVTEGHIHHRIGGDWRLVVYTGTLEYAEHLALVKGDVAQPGPVHVRMHAANLMHDIVLGDGTHDLHASMAMIAGAGRGVVVILRDWRPDNMSGQIRRGEGKRIPPPEIRDYGIRPHIPAHPRVSGMVRRSEE